MNPLFDEIAATHPDLAIPDTVPTLDSATQMLSPVGTVTYGGHTDVALGTVDVLPRSDDWCEDRAPHELSDDDGRD